MGALAAPASHPVEVWPGGDVCHGGPPSKWRDELEGRGCLAPAHAPRPLVAGLGLPEAGSALAVIGTERVPGTAIAGQMAGRNTPGAAIGLGPAA